MSFMTDKATFLETLLRFLYDHIDKGGDVQARVKWTPNTVVLWDNRVTAHVCPFSISIPTSYELTTSQSAIVDYGKSKERRHGARITPQAERPIPALDGLDLSV